VRTLHDRARDVGARRGRLVAARFGTELRIARTAAGLTQAQLGRRASVSQQVVSQAERGDAGISLDARCRLAAAAGHEVAIRLYPVATVPLRDSGQILIADAIAAVASPSWQIRLEEPIGPGEMRAADMLLIGTAEVLHIEIERKIVDLQAQLRSAQLKRSALAERMDRPLRLVLALPAGLAARRLLEAHGGLVLQSLPAASDLVWRAIRRGVALGQDGLLFVRPRRTADSGTR
jgi:transcriptional regulator with XRE-family HTH domain